LPELPEVEIAQAGITKHISGNTIAQVVAHSDSLRWPISAELATILPGQIVQAVERRGKYLLLQCPAGVVLIHLGMTGQLRIVSTALAHGKHDHFDLIFHDGVVLRLNDVRRFGSIIWAGSETHTHELLSEMGPEPLGEEFDGSYLYQKSRGRKITIKQFLMDHKVVAGIGNIYANESLFHAGIRPTTPVGRLSKVRSHDVDPAQVVGCQVDLLTEEPLAYLVMAQDLGKLEQQRAGAAGGVVDLVDLGFANAGMNEV